MIDKFIVLDSSYNEVECEVLALTEIDDKDVCIYKDNTDEIYASYYNLNKDKLTLFPIYDNSIYDKVDKYIEENL